MTLCRSWRPVATPDHPAVHHPGSCRRCWRPCYRQAVEGTTRCEECLYALAQHTNVDVRRSLAAEADLPVDAAELLATDFDSLTSAAARWHLDHRSPTASPVDTRV